MRISTSIIGHPKYKTAQTTPILTKVINQDAELSHL
jgi:hypothetical protein